MGCKKQVNTYVERRFRACRLQSLKTQESKNYRPNFGARNLSLSVKTGEQHPYSAAIAWKRLVATCRDTGKYIPERTIQDPKPPPCKHRNARNIFRKN